MILEISIPDLPLMTNNLLRRHWSFVMKEKDKWHGLVFNAVDREWYGKNIKPFEKANILFERHSVREPDWDGLVSGFKFVTDGLVKAGVLIDDKPSVILDARYKWHKAKKDRQGIRVFVEAL